MRPGLGWSRDPALHLIALSTVILGTAVALGSHAGVGNREEPIAHPRGCHACSVCPREAGAVRDAYLIRTGSIDPTDGGE